MPNVIDRAVLELAFTDAFYDVCFYEGDKFVDWMDSYLTEVDNKTNTKEQDATFLETTGPYIKNSLKLYSAPICEGFKEGGPKNDPANTKDVTVGGELSSVSNPSVKKNLQDNAGIKSSTKKLAEDIKEIMIQSAKSGSMKYRNITETVNKNLTESAMVGITSGVKRYNRK